MNIMLNGKQKEISSPMNLKNLIEQFCKNTNHVIAELNGSIVKNHQWKDRILKEGDTLELVNFVGGG